MSRFEKLRARLKEQVESGAYYEAQQTYKASFYRYAGKGNFEDARAILQDGAVQQLWHKQFVCGSELLRMLLENYVEKEVVVESENLESIIGMLRLYEDADDENPADVVKEMRRSVGLTLKWVKQKGSHTDAQKVHTVAATIISGLIGSKGLGEASLYFSLSDDMASYANVLQQSIEQGRPEERDLFVARAVLQVLGAASRATSFAHLEAARDLKRRLPSADTPLDHYVTFLLVALGKSSVEMFMLLKQAYTLALQRDPYLVELVSRIGSAFLGLGAPSGGVLDGLLSSLMGSAS